MSNSEGENPCSVCGHYHLYEGGEICGICGHTIVLDSSDAAKKQVHVSEFASEIFASEILPDFLYLGSYDNATNPENLMTQGISCVLNTVPMARNLYRKSFTYHGLQNEKVLQFDDAIKFLDQCEKDKARVLVHCMFGKYRSPAVVIAYLMKRKGWRLAESHQWVKERRPTINISPAFYEQLQEFERSILSGMMSAVNINDAPTPESGVPKIDIQEQVPVVNNAPPTSVVSSPASNIPPLEFTFGASLLKLATGGDVIIDGS